MQSLLFITNTLKTAHFFAMLYNVKMRQGDIGMEAINYIATLADTKCVKPNGNVFNGIWQSYERVVVHSLITSFGLDFIVQDRQGGDVDSIRNVRSSGFKSDEHRAAYDARGGYDTKAYHTHPQYLEIAQSARRTFNETGVMQQDAYVPGNTVAYSRASSLGKER